MISRLPARFFSSASFQRSAVTQRTFSPSLLQYKGLKGSLTSITIRALWMWNAAMFGFELFFFPNDWVSTLKLKKIY